MTGTLIPANSSSLLKNASFGCRLDSYTFPYCLFRILYCMVLYTLSPKKWINMLFRFWLGFINASFQKAHKSIRPALVVLWCKAPVFPSLSFTTVLFQVVVVIPLNIRTSGSTPGLFSPYFLNTCHNQFHIRRILKIKSLISAISPNLLFVIFLLPSLTLSICLRVLESIELPVVGLCNFPCFTSIQ